MILTTEITKIQESLKQKYSIEEYDKEIKNVNEQFNGDLEFLAYMAEDHAHDHVIVCSQLRRWVIGRLLLKH